VPGVLIEPADDAFRQDAQPLVAVERLAPAAVGGDERSEKGHRTRDIPAVGRGERAGERDVLFGEPRLAGRLDLLVDRGSRSDPVATAVPGGQAMESSQLGERLGMVFDPQVEDAVVPRFASALGGDDEESRRLTAAEVPAGRLSCVERVDQTLGKRSRPSAKLSAMAGQTPTERSMFPWTRTPSPARCPASGMQAAPVWIAPRPSAARKATCRESLRSSASSSSASASSGERPAAISSSPRGP